MNNRTQKSRHATEERVDFIPATIHGLKTSLTAIIVSSELLADELQVGEGSVPGRLIQSIIRNAHNIDERLSLLSKGARWQAGDFQFQPETVEIGQIIHSKQGA